MRTDNDTHVHGNETTTTLNFNKGCIFMDNSLIAEISRKFLRNIYEKMLLPLLTPSIKFALKKNIFLIIIDTIIDTGKSPGMENSGGKKSGWENSGGKKSGGENSGGENSEQEKFRWGKFQRGKVRAGKNPAGKSQAGKIPFAVWRCQISLVIIAFLF